MKTALIIQGSSAAGKTTLARQWAKERKGVHLAHDFFLFDLLPHKPEGKEHFSFGNQCYRLAFEAAIKDGKDLVLDGALISLDESINNFKLQEYLDRLREQNYSVVQVALFCSYDTAKKRMQKRSNDHPEWEPVPEPLFKKISIEVKNSLTEDVVEIQTDDLETREVLLQIDPLFLSETA